MLKAYARITLTALASCFLVATHAQESVEVAFEYEGNANFGNVQPSLGIAEFTDSRGVDNPALIADGYVAEAPLAAIVRDAFAQAFTKSGVDLVAAGEDMLIAGDISGVTLENVERGGVQSLQLTIRTRIRLQGGNRTIYEVNLFGRGSVPVEEGVAAAVHASLNRMTSDLARDNYFTLELQ